MGNGKRTKNKESRYKNQKLTSKKKQPRTKKSVIFVLNIVKKTKDERQRNIDKKLKNKNQPLKTKHLKPPWQNHKTQKRTLKKKLF